MEECNQFLHNQNLYNICTGNSNLPRWKLNGYRIKLGLQPIFEELMVEETVKGETVLSYNNIGYGVGTELLHIYQSSGVPACQACFKLANKMNRWGPSKCLENMSGIVEDIMPRAKAWMAENKPWTHALLPNVFEEIGIRKVVEKHVRLAIENFNKKLSEKAILGSVSQKKPCNCGQ
jgi:hypothetical protein